MREKMKSVLSIIGFFCILGCSGREYWHVRTGLEQRERTGIHTFAKLYGYVRYFYPNQHAAEIDWYKFLIYGLNEIESCETEQELIEKLKELFNPIVPELCFNEKPVEADLSHLSQKASVSYCWEHRGMGAQPLLDNVFKSEIVNTDNTDADLPVTDSLYCFPVNERTSVYFPVAISYAHDNSAALQRLIKSINKIKFKLFTHNTILVFLKIKPKEYHFLGNMNFRMADIIVRWNIVRHFYPYYEEDGLNDTWDEHLDAALDDAVRSASQTEYYYTVCRLLSPVKDSHVEIFKNAYVGGMAASYLPTYYPDIQLTYCNDTCYYIARNDRDRLFTVTSVNGISVDSLIKSKSRVVSASTRQGLFDKLFERNLIFESFKKDSLIKITLTGTDQSLDTVVVKTDMNYYGPPGNESKFIERLNDCIYYINPTVSMDGTHYQEFKNHIPEFKRAKGLIVDLRGYPGYYTTDIITHFSQSKIRWGDFRLPVYYYPNREHVRYEGHADFLEPSTDYIPAPVVFLINSSSMSYCETIIDVLKENRIGKFIGQNTMGTNGDVTQINLPVYGFMITAIKDFSGHHGVGISPDIEVETTISDLQANRDRVLETAVNYIKQDLESNN
jgi:hypothetical protein